MLDALLLLVCHNDSLSWRGLGQLLYLAERSHFIQTARPIMGDSYNSSPWGPAPYYSLRLIDDIISESFGNCEAFGQTRRFPWFRVRNGCVAPGHFYVHPKGSLPKFNHLSPIEQDTLIDTFRRFGDEGMAFRTSHIKTHKAFDVADETQVPWYLFLAESSSDVASRVMASALENQRTQVLDRVNTPS